MSAATYDVKDILREHGYSVTAPRLLIFEILADQEPMSMHELYTRAKGKLDRASTYRIVNLFEKLGIAQRVNIGWKYKIELSDKFAEHHHHLACTGCGKVTVINEKELEHFIATVTAAYQFTPSSHQVEIQGLCHNCASTAALTSSTS